jgi:choline dehydrogenase-like flavoprotein
LRGTSGPISVRTVDRPTPLGAAFIAASQELGFDAPADYNAEQQTGFGFYYQINRTGTERCSAATGYLHPTLGRGNLTVEVGSTVIRLVVSAGRVTAVERVRDGELEVIGVRSEALLCAGALNSPKLLMLSGIGDAGQLSAHGIDCIENLPGVGANLQDHPFVPICYEPLHSYPDAEVVSEAGLFLRTRQGGAQTPPDLQFTYGPVKLLNSKAPRSDWAGPGITFAAVLVRPFSRGRVTLANGDPFTASLVDPNYLGSEADVDVLVSGVQIARDLAHTPAFDSLRGKEFGLGVTAVGRDTLRSYVIDSATTLWHPAGRCRMGTGPDAVVDPQIARARGRGPPMPRSCPPIVSGNTNAPSIMIAEKAADLMKNLRSPLLAAAENGALR